MRCIYVKYGGTHSYHGALKGCVLHGGISPPPPPPPPSLEDISADVR